MIDLHTHLLPGLDDGPASLDEALALARATVRAGVTDVVATPHVSSRYQNDPHAIAQARDALRVALEQARVPLRVHAGAEVALDRALELPPEQLHELHLGDGRYLLIESPLGDASSDPALVVHAIQEQGHRVLLAHPERSRLFQDEPAQLERLIAEGALTSVTASAFAGAFGRGAQRFATTLLQRGLVHNLVSDMHDRLRRPPGIAVPPLPTGDDAVSHAARFSWLTELVPAAILTGTTIPPGPAPPPLRRGAAERLPGLRRRRLRRAV